MASVAAVRTALASQIQTACGITCKPRMPDQINPPVAVILPGAPYAKYGITLGEGAAFGLNPVPVPTELNLRVSIFVSKAPSLERAQAAVDTYLGFEPSADIISIPTAILRDPTLGGVVEYCEPLDVIAYTSIEVGGQEYFHGMIRVQVSVTQDLS